MEEIKTYLDFNNLLKSTKKDVERVNNNGKQSHNALLTCTRIIKQNNMEIVECDIRKFLVNNSKFNCALLQKALFNSFGEEGYKNNGLLNMIVKLQGMYNGIVISKPNSYDDLINILVICNNIIVDGRADDNKKQQANNLIMYVQNVIANQESINVRAMRETELVIKFIDIITKSVDNNKLVKFDKNINLDYIYSLIDSNISLYDQADKSKIDGNYSNYIKEFINGFNNLILEDKNNHEYQKKLNKYYKNISKTPFNDLKYEQYPSFDDVNFKKYMMDLATRFEEDGNVNLHSITMLRYADSFRKNKKTY